MVHSPLVSLFLNSNACSYYAWRQQGLTSCSSSRQWRAPTLILMTLNKSKPNLFIITNSWFWLFLIHHLPTYFLRTKRPHPSLPPPLGRLNYEWNPSFDMLLASCKTTGRQLWFPEIVLRILAIRLLRTDPKISGSPTSLAIIAWFQGLLSHSAIYRILQCFRLFDLGVARYDPSAPRRTIQGNVTGKLNWEVDFVVQASSNRWSSSP